MRHFIAAVLGVLVAIALIIGIGVIQSPTSAEAAPAGYGTTIMIPGALDVHLTCMDGIVTATTNPVTNQFGTTGGSIAMALVGNKACESRNAKIRSLDNLASDAAAGATAYRYCIGSTLLAVTPVIRNQFGFAGGDIALLSPAPLCER